MSIRIRESLLDPRAYLVPGYAPLMPSFRGTLRDEEIDNVMQ